MKIISTPFLLFLLWPTNTVPMDDEKVNDEEVEQEQQKQFREGWASLPIEIKHKIIKNCAHILIPPLSHLECKEYDNDVWAACCSHKGNRIATARETGARIWNTITDECEGEFPTGSKVFNVTFSKDDTYLVTAGKREAVVWDIKTKKPKKRFIYDETHLGFLNFSADGSRLVTSQPDKSQIWDTNSGTCIQTFPNTNDDERAIGKGALSPDGSYFMHLMNGDFWNSNGIKKWEWDGIGDAVCFDHAGSRIAIADMRQHIVGIWESSSGKVLTYRKTDGDKDLITNVCFSPDDKLLAVAIWRNCNRIISIMSSKDLESMFEIEAHGGINSICFDTDSWQLFGVSDLDKKVNVWSGIKNWFTLNEKNKCWLEILAIFAHLYNAFNKEEKFKPAGTRERYYLKKLLLQCNPHYRPRILVRCDL